MAANFRIRVHQNSDNLHLRLDGDFDGSSACELLDLLNKYKDCYYGSGMVPAVKSDFEGDLYNTFITYMDAADWERNLKFNTDNRGRFVEVFKLENGGQVSFSTTKRASRPLGLTSSQQPNRALPAVITTISARMRNSVSSAARPVLNCVESGPNRSSNTKSPGTGPHGWRCPFTIRTILQISVIQNW